MEKLVVYKACDGKLFEDEGKCLSYEHNLKKYPKVKDTVIKALDRYVDGGKTIPVDVVCHTVITQKKPYAQKKVTKYFVVCGKYKFVDTFGRHESSVMNGFVLYNNKVAMNWYLAFRHFVEKIILGYELTDKFVYSEIEKINDENKYNNQKLVVNVLESNKKWEIDNPSWVSGCVAPYTFTMEKIE